VPNDVEHAGQAGVRVNGKREQRAHQKYEENGEVCRFMDVARGLQVYGYGASGSLD